MSKLCLAVFLTLTSASLADAAFEADAWIFSGQSNMRKIGGTVRTVVGELVDSHNREYLPIYAAAPGKPIEAWLDSDHRDHKLWTSIVDQVTNAKKSGHKFKGFVWYQGESNVNRDAGKYQDQLSDLVARVRRLTDQPQLPAIIVQIGSATAYHGKDWAAATVREAQRRFVNSDDRAALVTAVDAEIGDYTVHLSKAGSEVVCERIVAAADCLAYGNEKAHWGPQFHSAYFAGESRQHVVVQFRDVTDRLQLNDGWLAGFGVSTKTSLPEQLSQLEDAEVLGMVKDDFLTPIGGAVLDDNRLVLKFDQSLPVDCRLSYAAARNAQYGRHRHWGIEFGGVTDESDHQAPAFALVPIGKPAGIDRLPAIAASSPLNTEWTQIAVNCVGRFPDAVTAREDEAGIEGWRQMFWNPASSGESPSLFDGSGRVTPVGFESGVWYMSPYFRELRNSDDAIMASWCKHSSHSFTGLIPGERYDLAIYLLQGPPKGKVELPPKSRAVRVSVLHMNEKRKRKDATVVLERKIDVPADGTFSAYKIVKNEEDSVGNVLLLTDVPSDAHGRIDLAIETSEMRNGKLRWADTTLAGIQIRRH